MTRPEDFSATSGDDRRVVVLGGGILGCSAAWHLLKAGVRSVTVVDALSPGAATTGAGAGFVSHWSAGMIPLGQEGFDLQQYGLDFYAMVAGLGTEVGYRPNGTLIMALTEQGREHFVRPVLESPYAPPEMQDLTAAEIGVKMQGLVDASRVHSAAYNPRGIQVDTTLALGVVAAEIERLGGTIRSGTTVTAIEPKGDGVRLATDRGPIEADVLVVAVGAWTNRVLASVGYRTPLLRVLATRIVTDKRGLPDTIPTVQCRELRLWLRETFGAVMWGTGRHYRPLHARGLDDLEPGRPRDVALMRETFEDEMAELSEVFPPLRGAELASWAQGVPCYTPDNQLTVGALPGHPAIVVVGGDNESGVTHGPGLGRLACEIALGRTPFVATERFRPDRYGQDDFPTEAEIETSLPAWRDRPKGSPIFGKATA